MQVLQSVRAPSTPPALVHVRARRGFACAVPALLLGFLLAGCSSTLSGGEDLRPEIRRLEQRIVELQRKAAISEVEIGRLQKRLNDLEGQKVAASRPTFERADPAPPLGVERVAGRIDPPTHRPPVESAVESPAGSRGREESIEVAPAAQESSARPITPAAQALYDRGYTLYHQGQYLEAEASFQRFVQGFPESELADNAQYWIGESRYSRQDFRGALAAFRQAANRYPSGNKVPDALLKAGQCLEGLGDLSGARETYSEVQRRFPETATALIAGERLASLEG